MQNKLHRDLTVIEFVDRLIEEAASKNVSDIHIEPLEQICRIRFRRDGILYEVITLKNEFALQVVTRLKIMAQLNIAEKRLPQDGHIPFSTKEHKFDLRVSTCPTLFGEKIVLRLLQVKMTGLSIDALGFTLEQATRFMAALTEPQGLILVTGPTGSGKTMTLYTALHTLNKIEKNIISVEDPVEIELPGINQVNVNPRIGLTFAHALRAFLRQDPDILMIGEIRDSETATIALQAAQTGHLVLATLHTNSASESVTRLKAMGAALYQLEDALKLIISQRLIRKSCEYCQHELNNCSHCLNGYAGRIGIFEFITPTSKIIKNLFNNQYTKQNLLWEMALDKVEAGITNYAEIFRVLGNRPSCTSN